jgi:hypothetical protein
VRNVIKRILIGTMFAVAMLGGGELPILHAPQFAEAHAFMHAHMLHEHVADAGHAADHATHDHGDSHDQSPGSDRGCTHVHAHCCASTAILVAATMPTPAPATGLRRLERRGAVPYGQLSNPPLRPPRRAV